MTLFDGIARPLTVVGLVIIAIAGARALQASAEPNRGARIVVLELDTETDAVTARVVDDQELADFQSHSGDFRIVRSALRIDLGSNQIDPLDAGLPWYWLAFGFGAQLLFTARMIVQWIASERAKASVVPTAFWLLSALGGLMLLTYFLRRGDPVGVTGQAFGLVIYARNLFFIRRTRAANATQPGPGVGVSAGESA